MLKKFLKLFGETKRSESNEQTSVVNEAFSGTTGVFEDGRLYVNRRNEGYVDGKHFTEYVETVKQLKRAGRLEDAEILLLKLVNATEAESGKGAGGVAPWYYEQLAIIYRKQNKLENEVSILKRYENQAKAPGVKPGVLEVRLRKAEESLRKTQTKTTQKTIK